MALVDTRARRALVKWIRRDARVRSRTKIAKALGISQPSVTKWTEGQSRPEPHLRTMLETLTSGEVRASDWELPTEAAAIKRVHPLTGTD